MALCRASWLDWKNTDLGQLDRFIEHFRSAYAPSGENGSFAPSSKQAVLGLNVERVFPESMGMAVGFSVSVEASFDQAQHALELDAGKSLQHCERGEGMRTCELPIAPQRTLTLMSTDPQSKKITLIGCYYLYEK